MSLKDTERQIALHYSQHAFLATVAGVVNGGVTVFPEENPTGQAVGPCAYASNVGSLTAGDLVKCVRLGALIIVEYRLLTSGAVVAP